MGQRRKTSITVQGRFKQACGLEDIISGQEFDRPAVNLPAKWLVESVLIKVCPQTLWHLCCKAIWHKRL